MFTFISSYQGVFDFRRDRDQTVNRYRVDTNNGNRLTVAYRQPTAQELADFRAWQIATHKRDMAKMQADPKRYPPEFYEVTAQPRLLASEDSIANDYERERAIRADKRLKGKAAYDASLAVCPFYENGDKRLSWDELPAHAKHSWSN